MTQEIRTEDCVAAIIAKTGTKAPWKRTAKYRANLPWNNYSGMYRKNQVPDIDGVCYCREFVNKKDPNKIAFVWAVEDKVIEIRILEPKANCKNLYTSLSEADYKTSNYDDLYKDEYDFCNDLETAPFIKLPEDNWEELEGDDAYEEQDFENWEVDSITDTEITMHHGGDWQECLTVTYRLMSDDKFYYDPKSVKVTD